MLKKKYGKITLMTMVIYVFVVLVGCAKVSSATKASANEAKAPSKVEEIKKAGKLVIGTSADYPPVEFHMEVNGKDEIVGFDISIAKEIAKDLGVELEIKDMKFDGLLAALNTNNLDIVLAGMVPTEERKKSVDFSKVYHTGDQGVLARVGDKDKYKKPEDLKGKVLGVQKGSLQEKIASAQFQGSEVKVLASVGDLVLSLKTGKVDAVLIGASSGKGYVSKNQDIALTDIKPVVDYEGTAVAIKKGNADLVEQINKTIARLKKEDKIDKYYAEAEALVEKK